MLIPSCLLFIVAMLAIPLPVDRHHSLDAEAAAKPVVKERLVHSADSTIVFDIDPHGSRAKGSPSDPDYAVYGHKSLFIDLDGENLEDYNRLAIDITPDCPGLRVINLTLSFENRYYSGDGFNTPVGEHLIHLDNGAANRCYLEIGDLRRDNMRGLRFSVTLKGMDLPVRGKSTITVSRIAAQKVAVTEPVSGWAPHPHHIVYSMSGYDADGPKTAIINPEKLGSGKKFILREASTGNKVYSGEVKVSATTTGRYGVMDFSCYDSPGQYVLEAGDMKTDTFPITRGGLWDSSCRKVLNFIYSQRCGYPVDGIHSACHLDLTSIHGNVSLPYAGGWHDAGDLSQQTLQTADVAFSLLELYDRKRESSPELAERLREEAVWGLDFVLRNRYGDGYHASSMGLLLWTDGRIGSHDDINTVRVQNVAYDNYLYAAYEAYAARVLADDKALAAYLTQVAVEDYDFACAKFDKDGFGGWITPYEHTYCTSESQHMATASWAASMLYELTGDKRYGEDAVEYVDYVLDSQCVHPVGTENISGFFYRNPDKRSVVHFIHQSREQIYMQALTALCHSQPSHHDYPRWIRAIYGYGGYIKAMMKYTAPYGMIPSGIYRDDEPRDTAAFYALHLFPPTDAGERFDAQRRNGIDVGDGYFVKRFPVWFNIYNGNLAVHTSMGKAAALCARFLGDDTLMDIAREQLYWIVGKNPFAQSMIYGEGHRYPELNNFSSGRITGSMPVGIRSLGDTDEPYWPQFNCACYKEVWVTSAGKWLSLVAETESGYETAPSREPDRLVSQNAIP